MAKIYIARGELLEASGDIIPGEHSYWVYDPDGDPTSGDERVIRGGQTNNPNDSSDKRYLIEVDRPLSDSRDALDGDHPFDDRWFTTVVDSDEQTVSDVWDGMTARAKETGIEGTDPLFNKDDGTPYDSYFLPEDNYKLFSTNCNCLTNTIGQVIPDNLVSNNFDFGNTFPIPGGDTGQGQDYTYNPDYQFMGHNSLFGTTSDETVILDSENPIIFDQGGTDTYVIDATNFVPNGQTMFIIEDNDTSTADILKIEGFNPNNIRLERVGDDVHVYLPGDITNPSVVLVDQFSDTGNPKLSGIEVVPPNGQPSQFLPLDNPSDIPVQIPMPVSGWVPAGQMPITDTPGEQPSAFSALGGGDPLVLDINGNGAIDLINIDAGAHFDIWGDGYSESTGWVGGGDGLLAIDTNNNGNIDNVGELFGSGYTLTYLTESNFPAFESTENGFGKLATHDSNGDGIISSLDDVWSDLLIWVDTNENGISDAGELETLDTIGIASIDVTNFAFDSFQGLSSGGFTREIAGNTITHTGSFTMDDGGTREIVDVWFDTDFQNTYYNQDYTLDVRTLFLPTLRGYGQIADLHIASSIDNGSGGLLEQVQSFAAGRNFTALFNDFDAVRGDVENILFAWAGIDAQAVRDNGSYSEHGLFGRMPEFLFIRQFMGQDSEYTGTWIDQSPYMPKVGNAVEAISQTWDNIVDAFAARLVFQSGGSELFDVGVSYNAFSDVFEGTIDLTQVQIDALEVEATAHSDVEGFWHNFAVFIDQVKGVSNLSVDEVSWISSAVSDSSSSTLTWADVTALLDVNTINALNGGDTVTGTRGDDLIIGGSGADTLIGGEGNDVITAGGGYPGTNDILDGGLGNDILKGGYGDDIYRYDYGHDVISGATSITHLDTDIIEFGAGINPNDVSFHITKYASALGAEDSIHVFFDVEGRGTISVELHQKNNAHDLIDELHFADGTVVSTDSIDVIWHATSDLPIVGANTWLTSGTTYVYGHDGDDQLHLPDTSSYTDGGLGNDAVFGGEGDDTLLLTGGNKQFYGDEGNDKILLPEGYTLDDVSFYRQTDLNVSNPNPIYQRDALIEVEGLGSISIIDQFKGGDDVVETLELFDGTTIDLLAQNYITVGTDSDDTLNGTDSPWPSTNDTYLFGQGNDVINDTSGIDTILFTDAYTLVDLTIYKQVIGSSAGTTTDLIIEDIFGNSLLINNQFYGGSGSVDYDIEKLQFADGSIFDIADLQIEIRGSDQNDSIDGIDDGGTINNDVIYAGDGDDSIHAGEGVDTVVYEGVYANYTITELTTTSYNNYFSVQDNVGTEGTDHITDIEFFRFADGLYHEGTFGSETLNGTTGDDILNPLSGNDVVNGLDGNDSFIYSGGLHDIYNGDAGIDVVNFTNFGSAVWVDLDNGPTGVESWTRNTTHLNSGTWIKIADLNDIENVIGSSFDDSIWGDGGDNIITGGDGNDMLYGDGGVDTAVFSGAYANYTITNNSGTLTVIDNVGSDGSDTIDADLERLQFTDGVYQNGAFMASSPPPIAVDDAFTGTEDQDVIGNVLTDNGSGIDSDPDGDALSVVAETVSTAQGGVAVILANGDFIYTPAANLNGADNFDYILTDVFGTSDTATVTITLAAVNDDPIANDDSTSTNEDTAVIIDVLANDIEPDGDSLAITITGAVTNGTLNINGDNTITYTPGAGYTGADSFTYQIADGNGGTSTADVNITVNASLISGTSGSETLNGTTGDDIFDPLSGNDIVNGLDGNDRFIYSGGLHDVYNGGGGTDVADFSGFGSAVWVDLDNGTGVESWTRNTTHLNSGTWVEIANLNNIENVMGSDFNDSIWGDSGDNIITGGQGNDTLYGDGGVDTAVFSGAYANYTITDNAGTLTVVDNVGSDGTDTIDADLERLQFTDGTYQNGIFMASSPPPVAADDSFNGSEDVQITGNLLADNGNGVDSDPDGDTLSAQAETIATAQGGVAVILANGDFTYTPATHFNGMDSFTYTLLDQFGALDSGTVSLTVAAVNDDPIANDDSTSTNEDTAVIIDVLANDVEPDDDSLAITITGAVTNGTLNINGDNTITYTPGAGYTGADSFTYQIADANGGTSTADVNITINTPLISGTSSSETLNGTTGDDIFDPLSGNDVVNGLGGNDRFIYSGGLYDVYNGGAGTDVADFSGFGSAVWVDLDNGSGVESWTRNTSNVNSGTWVRIADLNDVENVDGSNFDDSIWGDGGDNIITGGEGNDMLYGDGGNDMLYGGNGVDKLWGDLGADSFIFDAASAFNDVDEIKDFDQSEDIIDISDILDGAYNSTTDAITDFVQITDDGTNSFLSVDVNGATNGANFVDIARLDGIISIVNVATLEQSWHLITEVV